jgi:hypothetical protein
VTTHLGDLLEHARHESFVGRRPELTVFTSALRGESAVRVLFVHGPGGIGKTTLLLELRDRARRAGRPVHLVEGREVDPSPDGLLHAISGAGQEHVPDSLAGAVLLVDGYEQLAPIDAWVRMDFIPALPSDVVVVLAGREPPAAPWRTDPGWRRIVAVLPLNHFDEAESRELLDRAGVASDVHERLLALGRGHPLAMAMLADAAATGTVPETLADVPDVVTALLEILLRDAPSDAHVAGLAACVKAWLTTEDLLRDLVGEPAPQVWAWLARRPFVASGPRGLWPHDLARDVLDAEFERRIPERYKAVHRVVHDHVVAGLRTAAGLDRQLLAQHLVYLHRRSPLTATFYELRTQGSAAVVPGRPDEHAEVIALTERDFGPASARVLEGWLAEYPQPLNVVRTPTGIGGFAYRVVHPTGSTMEDRDPVTRSVLEYVARTGPTRPGEQVDIGRFFGGASVDGRYPYGLLAGAVSSLIEWVVRPFAWSFIVTVVPDLLGPYFEYLAFTKAIDMQVDGVRHVIYGMDWRRLPVDVWLDLMNEREHSGGTGPAPASLLRPPPLDRATFATAVRNALADLHRPDRLRANPLMGTALAGSDVDRLRTGIEEAIDHLAGEPKGDVLRSVLTRTYVRAAPTQEAAAEVLGLPFSTYRRHLGRALEQLTDLLWAVEIGEIRLPARRPPVSTD